jgi:hypothetical protein
MEKLTDQELAGLSEEERAAVQDDVDGELPADTATDTETDETVEDTAETQDADAKDEAEEAVKSADETKTAEAAAADLAAAAATDEDEAAAEEEVAASPAHAPIVWPEDYKGSMATLTAERAELTRKFSDGEITLEEKDREQDRIDEARHDLRAAQQKAEIQAESIKSQTASAWRTDQDRFFKDNPDYAKNRMLLSAFDTYVREEGANPANANRDGAWFLQRAHERVQEDLKGLGVDTEKKVTPVVPVKPRPKPNLAAVPRTLGNLPAAQDAEVQSGSEFAAIDKLSGLDLENALARMTPEQEQRYLRSS